MPEPLMWVLILAIAVLTSVLVPLMLQLRKTAMAVERLATTASSDIHSISQDVHSVREKVDAIAETVRRTAARFSNVTEALGSIGALVKAVAGNISRRRAAKASLWRNLLSMLISLITSYFAARQGVEPLAEAQEEVPSE